MAAKKSRQRSRAETPARTGEPYLAIRVIMLPRDTNELGTIFGGTILSYLDLAGAVEARRTSMRELVTVAMKEVVFHAPVFVGDIVSFRTNTLRVGRTSITVHVVVEAERVHEGGRRVKVTEAEVTYVAVDADRRPTPIRPRRNRGERAARPDHS